MKKRRFYLSSTAVFISLALVLFGCGGGGGSSSSDAGDTTDDPVVTGTGLNNAESVTGTVRSASGDPIAGATVYIPGTQVASRMAAPSRVYTQAVNASDGTVCEDPPDEDSPLAAACSAADGTFVVDTSAVPANADQIVFQKGALRMVQGLSCSEDPCALDSSTTTFDDKANWPRVAVVTGFYDRIEDVLAKLADPDTTDTANGSYGRVNNQTGIFVYGSEFGTNLTIIDGTYGGFLMPDENADKVSYDTWESYFDGTNALVVNGKPVFDIIFLNCGNDSEFNILLSPDNLQQLRDYVAAGGRLYATDLSYDYIEQPFPAVMQFHGEADDAATPGSLGAAESGTGGISVNATVNNASFRTWLENVAVNRHDASTPGNPDIDCLYMPDGYAQITGALTDDDLIPIGDFLSIWARMIGPHTGQDPTVWISSGSGVNFDGLENRPLTVSQTIGANGGLVIYSSYHTADTCPTLFFWPQERVLQYLIFEAF